MRSDFDESREVFLEIVVFGDAGSPKEVAEAEEGSVKKLDCDGGTFERGGELFEAS